MLPPKIQNIICTADLRQYIDATKFNNFPWGRYDVEYYGGRCGYVKDEEMKGRVSVFLSGKMISTGATTVPMSIQQLEHTMDLLTRNKLAERVSLQPKIQNIVATVDLQIKFDVNKVIQSLSNYIYEPDNFPAIIYKSTQGISYLIFASGKIVIAGAKGERQLKNATFEIEKLKICKE